MYEWVERNAGIFLVDGILFILSFGDQKQNRCPEFSDSVSFLNESRESTVVWWSLPGGH